MKLSLPLLLLTVVLFLSCQRELDPSILQEPEENNTIIAAENEKLKKAITTQTREVYLAGYIKDEAGKPVAQAKIQAGGKETQTDAEGYFNFKKLLTVNRDYALVTVTKSGYMNGFKTFTPNKKNGISHSIELVLQTKSAPKTFTASSGGSVTIDDKIKLDFPANSIVTKSGQPYNGNVQVVGRYIDPAAETFLETMPGTLSGLNLNGQIRAMESYGMASIDLYDASGNELEVAASQNVTMKMPASAGSPATIPLWHFNETYGVWIQTGTAKKEGSEYIASVNHFSVWNLDVELNSNELELQLITGDSSFPLSSVLIQISNATTGAKYKSIPTDANGKLTLINCPSDIPLKLTAVFSCETIEKTIAPVTANRTEIVDMSPTTAKIITFTLNGTLYGCTNDTLKNQPFEIRLNNGNMQNFQGTTDANGHYEISVLICETGTAIQARAYTYINEILKYSAAGTLAPGNYYFSPAVCEGANIGSIINEDAEIIFPDSRLETKIREKINKPAGEIKYADVKDIDTLNLQYTQITSLEGLQYLSSLIAIEAESNNFTSLVPLEKLSGLRYLALSSSSTIGNEQVKSLQNLTNLETLYLESNPLITDISFLSRLTKLFDLNLYGTSVVNIDVLSQLTSLENLDIGLTKVTNFTPIENLTRLQGLGVDSLFISNLSFIKKLVELEVLIAMRNNITDISVLADMKKLTYCYLLGNKINDLSPLGSLAPTLVYLQLEDVNLTSINKIMIPMPNLRQLYIRRGNTIPQTELDNFKTLNPNCSID